MKLASSTKKGNYNMEERNMELKQWPRKDPKRERARRTLMPSLNRSGHQVHFESVPEYDMYFPECKEWLIVKNEDDQVLGMFDEEHGRAVFPQRKKDSYFSRIHEGKPILFKIDEIRPWGVIVTLRTQNIKRLRMTFH